MSKHTPARRALLDSFRSALEAACAHVAGRPMPSNLVETLETRTMLADVAASQHNGGCGCAACSSIRANSADKLLAQSIVYELQKTNLGKNVSLVDSFGTLKSIPQSARPGAQSYILANAYSPFTVDFDTLIGGLSKAPLEFTKAANNPITIAIPSPDGSLERFNIVESPIMEPKLAAMFPEIKTYAGQGIDDPTATIRFDHTPQGFHAQVLSANGSWYIDPYWHLDTSVHISYRRSDMVMSEANLAWKCGGAIATITDQPPEMRLMQDDSPQERSGTQLRQYRLALAATGEYTAFHGGTVALGQAAIVTAMNRVNGVYERELSIRMNLVANNNLLVYTNSATDPYTNNNGSTMLGQNQTNVDAVIGNANYDIGHVFSTGGGGIAGLGVVGFTGSKARGVTGSPSPIGDAFTIDYVAHEMGHQFNANHTFNNCGGSNDGSGSANLMEPGSGSTIMAYAGICGSTNIQNFSDDYFHSRSFDQIISFVDATIPGVGTRTATGNSVPTVNAGLNYTIPANTPFELTATGSDADGDTITYNWEQRNGSNSPVTLGSDPGSGPILRSWPGTTNPTRTFPRLSNLLNNTTPLGERLPGSNRTLNFRVTVRDNRLGGGGVNTADMTVTSVNTGTAFTVDSFNGLGTSVAGGSLQTISWTVAGTTGSGINAANVKILLSTDGGNTFPITLLASTPNNGSAQVQMPYNLATGLARIKVQPTNNIFFDINNFNFSITNVASPTGIPVLASSTDTGASNADGITNRNNSTPARNLVFNIPNTNAGATVRVFANGVEIGSAVAAGANTVVTSNGSLTLADGTYAITATQQGAGQAVSPLSVAGSITIDSAAPQASFAAVSPNPRVTNVGSIDLTFNESVNGLVLSDILLIRNGSPVTLTGASLSGSGQNFTISGLSDLTAPKGNYAISLIANPAGADVAGNGAVVSFVSNWSKFILGDMNDDGAVNNLDIAPFVQALTSPTAYAASFPQVPMPLVGDINNDGAVNNLDIAPFVALLTGGRPEASTVPPQTARLPQRAPTRPPMGVFSDTDLGSGSTSSGGAVRSSVLV